MPERDGCIQWLRLSDDSALPYSPPQLPSLGFSADGARFAAGEGSVVVWETASWRQIWRADEACGDSRWDRGLVLTADGAAIVTDRGVWQLPGGSEVHDGPLGKSHASEP